MKKESFEEVMMELVELNTADIITTSGDAETQGDYDVLDWNGLID